LQLRGNTYDAKHLDSFLNSTYGLKSFNANRVDIARRKNGSPLEQIEEKVKRHHSVLSKLPNYLVDTQSIKPSVNFLSPGRDSIKFTQFVDLYDGPSSL
jgi:hypothetical protein